MGVSTAPRKVQGEMEERRKFLRFEVPVDIKYRFPEKAVEGISKGKNFGREGIGLYLKEEIPRQTMVELEIGLPDEIVPIFAAGRVVWVKEADEQQDFDFIAGVELTRISSFDKSRILEYVYNWRYKAVEKFKGVDQEAAYGERQTP